jgi:hypothetical protein
MRSLIPATLVLGSGLLAGCGLDLVCPYDPHDWYDADNATYTLLEADFSGNKGSFDFDPVGQSISRRKGSYNLNDGNLAWVDTYKGAHYLAERTVEGYGTVYDNGNLDLLVKVSWTDILEQRWAELLRIERYRCEGNVTRYGFDPDWTVEDAPSDNAHTEYWASEIKSDTKVTLYGEYSSSGSKMVMDRTCTDKVLSNTDWDYGDGAYVGSTKWKYDGTGEREWSQFGAAFGADYDYHGDDEYYFDGSSLQEYGVYNKGTDTLTGFWSLLYQYDGAAAGTYTGYNAAGNPSLECDVTITTNGNCTAACDDGQTYDCS